MREDGQQWTEMNAFHKPSLYSLLVETNPEGVVRYTFDSNRSEEELRNFFMESMKWYRWTTVSRSDPYARSLTVQVQLVSCKKFKFSCSSETLDRTPLAVRKPLASHSSTEPESFYELAQMEPAPNIFKWRVRVLRYFASAPIRDYFRS